jgi:hypothetical protein
MARRSLFRDVIVASGLIAAVALGQPQQKERPRAQPPAGRPPAQAPATPAPPKGQPAEGPKQPEPGHPLSEMAPKDVEAAMAAWMKTTRPGAPHEWLKQFEGAFKTTLKVRTGGPGEPPMESEGKTVSAMVLGGRFLESKLSASMMGMPMEGQLLLGFDNVRKQFTATWADTMGTGILPSHGSLDPSGKVLTMFATMDEPMTGEIGKTVKHTWRMESADRYTFTIDEVQYGEPFTVVEVVYERMKEGGEVSR